MLQGLFLFVILAVLAVPASAMETIALPKAIPANERIVGEVVEPIVMDSGMEHGPMLYDPGMGPQPIYLDEPGMMGWNGPNTPQVPGAWSWQVLPEGLIYKSYLAGVKEPRLASVSFFERPDGDYRWDGTAGARVGILRYGTPSAWGGEGWQLDVEAAAFPRLDYEDDLNLVSADFRAGIPLTYGLGAHSFKLGYYHLSSHLGDEFLLENPSVDRLNYSRDAIVFGHAFHPTPDWRVYGEVGYAFRTDGGSEPWEFQTGIEYSPVTNCGGRGAPFVAVNGHLREEVDFGGSVNFQFGWQWRGAGVGRLLRAGFQYYNGKSPQFSFFDEHEEQFGLGVWYDF